MLHAKLRNRTCQGLHRQGQGQGQGPSLQRPGQGQELDLQGQGQGQGLTSLVSPEARPTSEARIKTITSPGICCPLP